MATLSDLRKMAAGIGEEMAKSVSAGTATRQSEDEPKVLRKGEFVMDDGSPVEELNQVLLSKSAGKPAWVRELQEFNDNSLILASLLKCHPTETDYWKRRMHKNGDLRKSMDSQTSTGGSEWVPTIFSADWVRFVDLELKVANLLRRVDMPSDPYKIPFQSSQITVYKIAEQTSDAGTKITENSPQTGNFQLDAVKIGVRIAFSEELTEDSIVPVLPMLREELGHGVGKGIEDAIINGDTSGTHQDSDVTASTDRRKMFRGLRKHALGQSTQSLATYSVANIRALRAKMGKYGVDPSNLFFLTGPIQYQKQLLAQAEVSTVDKMGDKAVILNGQLAALDGIPVIVSSVMRETVNASGVYDGTTTTKSTLLLVYRPAWYLGDRRGLELKLWEDIQYGQSYLVGTARHAFNTPWTSDAVAVAGVNVDVS